MRWVSVSVRGKLRGCGAVNRARRRAGLLRRADSGGVQSERARKHANIIYTDSTFPPRFGPVGGGGLGRFGAAPIGGHAMTAGRDTRRLTVNLPAVLAAGVERLAQDAAPTTSAWVARILASAVRSLKPWVGNR